ncbi:MAG: riboflavin synthase [Chthoniobacteraceae bacterium]
MFTGLVEETGEVASLAISTGGARLTIKAKRVLEGLKVGDSIAVNGCCLTATSFDHETISFDLLQETVRLTNLHALQPGAPVNLERALAAGARLGGHFVQGHIDCTAKVIDFTPSGADFRLDVAIPPGSAQYLVPKGSIAVDGISLTVAEVGPESFTLWIIPHTLAATNLRAKKGGDLVNLEFDLLAKYVERMLAVRG